MIEALLAFLKKNDPEALKAQLSYLQLTSHDFEILVQHTSKREWLGAAERIVFNSFKKCARYVSPFSINNPDGWRYWLIHLANSHRARQVYNDILHQDSETQAHYGRSGLNMLAHDPNQGKTLYLFNASAREQANDRHYFVVDVGDLACAPLLSKFLVEAQLAAFIHRPHMLSPPTLPASLRDADVKEPVVRIRASLPKNVLIQRVSLIWPLLG